MWAPGESRKECPLRPRGLADALKFSGSWVAPPPLLFRNGVSDPLRLVGRPWTRPQTRRMIGVDARKRGSPPHWTPARLASPGSEVGVERRRGVGRGRAEWKRSLQASGRLIATTPPLSPPF